MYSVTFKGLSGTVHVAGNKFVVIWLNLKQFLTSAMQKRGQLGQLCTTGSAHVAEFHFRHKKYIYIISYSACVHSTQQKPISTVDKLSYYHCMLCENREFSNIVSAYHKVYFQMWREVRFDFWAPLEVKPKMATGPSGLIFKRA